MYSPSYPLVGENSPVCSLKELTTLFLTSANLSRLNFSPCGSLEVSSSSSWAKAFSRALLWGICPFYSSSASSFCCFIALFCNFKRWVGMDDNYKSSIQDLYQADQQNAFPNLCKRCSSLFNKLNWRLTIEW